MIVLERRKEHDILWAKNDLYNAVTNIFYEKPFDEKFYENVQVDLEILEVQKFENGLSAQLKLRIWKPRSTTAMTLEVCKRTEDSYAYFVENILSPRIREYLKAFAKIEKGCK